MEWRDEGALLSVRPHGESSAIIEVFTAAHGRHLGVVRGGGSRRMAGVLQPGAQLALQWQARLEEHMGAFKAEPLHARTALLNDRSALAALNSICALLHQALPERDPHPLLYAQTVALLDLLEQGGRWQVPYLLWEVSLLDEMGYALDLTSCALTGATQDLAYISPRTGRAVSRQAAGDWAPRLLPLPRVLTLQDGTLAEVSAALTLTTHFLSRALPAPAHQDGPLPEARARLLDQLSRSTPDPSAKSVAD
jgi:DNA repair protein RecO (recombination protein O)